MICTADASTAMTLASGALALQFSPIDDVQSAFFDIERGLPDGFAQGRVRMTCTADVFRAAAEFNYGNSFGD